MIYLWPHRLGSTVQLIGHATRFDFQPFWSLLSMKLLVKWLKRAWILLSLRTLMIDSMINIEVISTVTDRIQLFYLHTSRWRATVVSDLTQRELCKEEYIVSTFKNRIHYSLEDFECTSNCSDDCTDAMARYRIYEGSGSPGRPGRLSLLPLLLSVIHEKALV